MSQTVLLGAFAHEANTFVPEPVTRSDFQARRELFGDDVLSEMAGTETAIGGAIEAAADLDLDIVPTVAAFATPGGVVETETFEYYTGQIVDGVRDYAADLDGIILPLHGAMIAEDHTDGEGEILERVRDVVGEAMPVVVTLDLHGNVSDRMVDLADALVAYETYPHIDKAATGERGLRLLDEIMAGSVTPTIHQERPPLIAFQPKAYTPSGPMAEVMARARDLEDRSGVLKVNVLSGFYHADIPEMGFTVSTVTDADPELARRTSRTLAEEVWSMREQFIGDYPKPAEAIAEAKALRSDMDDDAGPIVMADFGSNPGGGGASDGTTVLRKMIEQDLTDAGWAIMYDPEVVEQCIEAGVGERVTVTLGGKSDGNHGAPIEKLDGYVKAITDGRYVNRGTSHSGKGVQNAIGRTIRFECGPADSVTVVVAETRASAFDAEIWRHVGLPPERLDYICIPSLIAFLGDYEPMSSEVILIDTPGLSAVNPARFDYHHIPRPLFPLDELADDAYHPG